MSDPVPGSQMEWKPVPDPTELTQQLVKREMAVARELMEERFNSVTQRFGLMESQRVEQKADTKAAVDAALAAAKEAVKEQTTASDRAILKSETATAEQIKQINVTSDTAFKGVSDSIGDIKDRITALESIRRGGKDAQSSMYLAISLAAAVITLGIYAALSITHH